MKNFNNILSSIFFILSVIFLFINWKVSLVLFLIFNPIVISRMQEFRYRITTIVGFLIFLFSYVWWKESFINSLYILIPTIIFQYFWSKFYLGKGMDVYLNHSLVVSEEESKKINSYKNISILENLLFPFILFYPIGLLLQFVSLLWLFKDYDFELASILFIIGEAFYILYSIAYSYVYKLRYEEYLKDSEKK